MTLILGSRRYMEENRFVMEEISAFPPDGFVTWDVWHTAGTDCFVVVSICDMMIWIGLPNADIPIGFRRRLS